MCVCVISLYYPHCTLVVLAHRPTAIVRILRNLSSYTPHARKRVKAGLVPIICVCPETIIAMVNSAEWQKVFANWDDSMVALCYDEVHMIFEVWRKSYPLIPSLRAWFTTAGVLALTATAYVVQSAHSNHVCVCVRVNG